MVVPPPNRGVNFLLPFTVSQWLWLLENGIWYHGHECLDTQGYWFTDGWPHAAYNIGLTAAFAFDALIRRPQGGGHNFMA